MARLTLGDNQSTMLRSLCERGSWYGGCGYSWGTYSATVRIMESLAKRGLADKLAHRDTDRRGLPVEWTEYRPTPAGFAAGDICPACRKITVLCACKCVEAR